MQQPAHRLLRISLAASTIGVLVASAVSAQGVANGFAASDATTLGLSTLGLRDVLILGIKAVLGLVGLAAVAVNVYAGAIWMFSKGDENTIKKAKKILVNGSIGLVIVIFSYGIVSFVSNQLIGNGGDNDSSGGAHAPGDESWIGALGGGILEAVYPLPYAQDVPRNTGLAIRFKELVTVTDLIGAASGQWKIDNCATNPQCGVLTPKIRIETDDGTHSAVASTDLVISTGDGGKTYQIRPAKNGGSTFLFGNSKTPMSYRVYLGEIPDPSKPGTLLTGSGPITRKNGQPGLRSYSWTFTIGTFIDNTPPHVVSVFPVADSTVPKNALVQIIFSEPIMIDGVIGTVATSPSGQVGNIQAGSVMSETVCTGVGQCVPGAWDIASQFTTLRFLSAIPCDAGGQPAINSCNEQVYCLPGSSAFTTTALSYQSGTGIGIQDMASNPLDGDTTKTGLESFVSNFSTSDVLDLTPPTVVTTTPTNGNTDVSRRIPDSIEFSKTLDASSINSDSIYLVKGGIGCAETSADPRPVPQACYDPFITFVNPAKNSEAQIVPLFPYLSPKTAFAMRAVNSVRDAFQNCFNPPVKK